MTLTLTLPDGTPITNYSFDDEHTHAPGPEENWQESCALIDAREEEIEGPLDVLRAGHALADLELAVLGVGDETSRRAARAVAAAWLMGAGHERDAMLADARALRRELDPSALPILLPALSLGDIGAWRKPLAYWWAALRGRY